MRVDLPSPRDRRPRRIVGADVESTPRSAATSWAPIEYTLRMPRIEIIRTSATPRVDAGGAPRGEIAGQQAHRAQDEDVAAAMAGENVGARNSKA